MRQVHQNELFQILGATRSISSLDPALLQEARDHLDNLTKPQGSLGRLEEISARLYAIYEGRIPLSVDPAILFTVAADHGVARQHVSAYPQEVTRQMVLNFLNGGGAVNVMSRETGMTLCLVDAGCAGGGFPTVAHPILLDRRLGNGTADLSREPAMSRETAILGVRHGIELLSDAADEGCQCAAIGEMGIGNTTSATALYCALFGFDPEKITGPGTGLSPEGRNHKVSVIRQALALHGQRLEQGDIFDVLACVGGFEIAVMTGIVLGAASERIPVLIDGFVATAAYAVAVAIADEISQYAFLSHASAEPGYQAVLSRLNKRPFLDLGFRLGEGTGCAMVYPLFRAAAAVFNDMATFTKAGVLQKSNEPIGEPAE